MKRKKPSIRKLLLSCDAVGPEDGVDPRYEFRGGSKVSNRKALQLCGQVAEVLHSLFAGECGDDVLRDLLVESVVPAPNTSRLLVTVRQCTSATATAPEEVLARLAVAQGLLRSEVAAAIHRRKAPELTFRLIDAPQGHR